MKNTINSVGVILSTAGAFLVWKYIADVNFSDKQAYLQGKGILEIPLVTIEDVNNLKLSIKLSRIGLGLILVGGLLQIVSNYFPVDLS